MIAIDERITNWMIRISKKRYSFDVCNVKLHGHEYYVYEEGDYFKRYSLDVCKVKLHGHEYYVDEDGDFFKFGEDNERIYYWIDECGAVAYDLLLVADEDDMFYGSRKVVYLHDESGNEYWKDDNGNRHYTREEG